MTTDPAPATLPRTVYTGRTTNWPMVAATSAGAVLLVAMGATGEGGWSGLGLPLTLVAIGVLAEVITGSSIRASAGPNGVDVRWGILGWPRCTYRLDQIATAEVVDVPWTRVSYGLWWTPRRTNCTVRSGPALRLVLTSGRIATVTVPDPALAVRSIDAARST
ncbi:hypothetical protein ACE2AJ_06375 [Aquihabitans daechungensis]|uniref:hypothetical protein n=1 Tax=Aquihabitans daechungensis TaxID=1052257 RepID=UPI003BA0C66E